MDSFSVRPMTNSASTLFHFDEGTPNFEDLGDSNGVTHWTEEVLRDALGYQTESGFDKAVTRAKQACLSIGYDCEDHFLRRDDGVRLFTRFACYLIAMNGDVRKPEVAAAQAYFAAIAETFENSLQHCEGIDRLLIRDEIKDGQKSLASTARQHGVSNYAFFQNKGYLGMYNMPLDKLEKKKGVRKGKLIDHMGKAEMAAHLFRITQTDEKIKNENIEGQKRLEAAAFDVGKKVRDTVISLSGTRPENLPAAEDVNKVRRKIKGAGKKFAKIDGASKKKDDE